MRCAVCVKAGDRSRVWPLGRSVTLMGWSEHYDEMGIFHSHDPNRHSSAYVCSKGHHWTVSGIPACPADECDYGKGVTDRATTWHGNVKTERLPLFIIPVENEESKEA